jgi:hypothetical protein
MEYAKQTETLPRRNLSLSWFCSLASWPCSFMPSRRSSMCAALPRPTVNGNKFVQRLSQGIHLSRVFITRAWHESWTAVCLWCLPSSWFKFQPDLNFRFFALKIKSKILFKFEGGWAIERLVGLNSIHNDFVAKILDRSANSVHPDLKQQIRNCW